VHKDEIVGILLDVTMPGMDDDEVFRRDASGPSRRPRHPHQKISPRKIGVPSTLSPKQLSVGARENRIRVTST
jgi:hypothetical protein